MILSLSPQHFVHKDAESCAITFGVQVSKRNTDLDSCPLPRVTPTALLRLTFGELHDHVRRTVLVLPPRGERGGAAGEGALNCCVAQWTPRCHLPCHVTVL